MTILGISAYYHDSSAALVVDGVVVAAACEERFSRMKHDKSFPSKAISFCIDSAGIDFLHIDYVVFYEKPLVKFERILSTHIHYAPKGYASFIKAIPVWLKDRLNMTKTISGALNELCGSKRNWDIRYVDHHLSHAAMAYYTSGYPDAAILVIDAVGENATTSIVKAGNGNMAIIKQQHFPHSIGLLYSAFTYFLGFEVNSDEYKVMGLAPYGSLEDEQTIRFVQTIESQLVNIAEDGSIVINPKRFTFMHAMKMVNVKQWEQLFEIPHRKKGDPILQSHKNLAAAIQSVTEKIILRLVNHAKQLIPSDYLCISGGCALNCSAMGKAKNSRIFQHIHVPFAPGDDGGAMGAALLFSQMIGDGYEGVTSPYTGPDYPDNEIIDALTKFSLSYQPSGYARLYPKVATWLSQGKIIGWFQGKMEFGPRALGNRSILADPRGAGMKNKVNSLIKFREEFRPFAPVVLEECASEYFNIDHSPYMMFATHVHPGVKDKLAAVTHIDRSARVQTVNREENAHLYNLLLSYKDITQCPVLLNTSFNVMGEPIVCTPEDAIQTFLNSGMDILIINNYIVEK